MRGGEESEEGNALHRCLSREIAIGTTLLFKVRGDLEAVEQLCRGEAKATNEASPCVWVLYLRSASCHQPSLSSQLRRDSYVTRAQTYFVLYETPCSEAEDGCRVNRYVIPALRSENR